MVPAVSDRVSPAPPYSGYHVNENNLPIQGSHLLWLTFPGNSSSYFHLLMWSYNPEKAETFSVWAISRSLATTWEITIVFSSFRYLDVSVPEVCFSLQRCLFFKQTGYPIRILADQFVYANPRKFSQLITSFIAYENQGIPHIPLTYFLSLLIDAFSYLYHNVKDLSQHFRHDITNIMQLLLHCQNILPLFYIFLEEKFPPPFCPLFSFKKKRKNPLILYKDP